MLESLEDILNSDTARRNSRRDFLKEISLVGCSLFLPSILGCGKEEGSNPITSAPTKKTPTTSDYGNYESYQSSTNNDGIINLVNKKGEDVIIKVVNERGQGVGGSIELTYYENNQGNIFIATQDPLYQYIPGFKSIGYLGKSEFNKQEGLIEVVNYLFNASRYVNLAYKFLRDDKFNFRHRDTLIRIPGIRHWADFSFNDIRNSNLFLNRTGVIIFPVFPEIGGPLIAGTNTGEDIMRHLDEFINILNTFGLEIDKKEQFEFYYLHPPFNMLFFFIPKVSFNIRDYVDTSQGNYWKYKVPGQSSLLEVKVQGYRNIDGKEVPAVRQSNGLTLYQGYDGNTFKTYGFELGGNFIKLTNPVVVGDNNLDRNKTYSTNTSYSGVANYNETQKYTYERFKVLPAKSDLSYRCWQLKNEVIPSRGNYAYQNAWLAKGIGQIKIYNPSVGNIRLVEAYISGKHHTGFTTFFKREQAVSAENIFIGAGPLIFYTSLL